MQWYFSVRSERDFESGLKAPLEDLGFIVENTLIECASISERCGFYSRDLAVERQQNSANRCNLCI